MTKTNRPFMDWLLESLTNPEEACAYINAAYKDSDEMFLTAILDVARAHQIARVARKAGVTREHLHRAFSKHGHPGLETLDAVLHAVGLQRGPVVPLGPKKSVSSSPIVVPSGKKRIARARSGQAVTSPLHLGFGFNNPAGIGYQFFTPVSAAAPARAMGFTEATLPAPYRVLWTRLGNTCRASVEAGLLQRLLEKPSGVDNPWFPAMTPAGAGTAAPLYGGMHG